MSEANAPFNPQGQPELDDLSSSPWNDPPAKETDGAETPNSALEEPLHLDVNQIFDVSELDEAAFEECEAATQLSTLNDHDFADDVSALFLENQTRRASSAPANSVSTNLSSIAAWSQDVINQMEPPNLTDLVTLIQELNQCNGALLDRVSQLEEALEYSQNALQAEVGRTQEVQSIDNAQDWATVQEQVTTLFNQLEFAHQANQRQQILIETLTGQLENSQERVAQLEREAALIQQHYNEQTQQLSKSESTCRDLQARLQRQQRYTLQFKAALEKCLEVPTPQYETGAVAAESPVDLLAEAPFLPKAQRIQPWSAHSHGSGKSPWMKLHHLDLPGDDVPAAEDRPEVSDNSPATLDLPSFGLSLLQVAEEGEANLYEAEAAIDRDLQEQVHRLTNDPALKHQLDAAVKPLAEMLAEALLADQVPPAETLALTSQPHSSESTGSTADELLASVMADAEDALWQDLARLIDVSTEDVVKASLSGDLAAFESLDFASMSSNQAAQPQTAQPQTAQPQTAQPQTAQPASSRPRPVASEIVEPQVAELPPTLDTLEPSDDAAAVAPLLRRRNQVIQANQSSVQAPPVQSSPVQEAAPAAVDPSQSPQEFIPALATSSWPSPVVYPLRPTKKRQSLAMVDLPTFPRS